MRALEAWAAAACVLCFLLPAGPVSSQELPKTLGDSTLSALRAEIGRAEAAGLPAHPLVLKALEGASKGATDQQIVAAVAALRVRLGAAAEALGGTRGEDVLVAGAGALYVGVELETLREIAEQGREDALGMALVVLGDLVQRGVPVEAASRTVISLGAAGIDAAALSDFRRQVDDDIRMGLAPGRATEIRLRGVLVRVGGGG